MQTHIQVDPLKAAGSLEVSPKVPAGAPAPKFLVSSKSATEDRRTVPVTYRQIQYTQNVSLNFNGLTWPYVSVATLVPIASIPVELERIADYACMPGSSIVSMHASCPCSNYVVAEQIC